MVRPKSAVFFLIFYVFSFAGNAQNKCLFLFGKVSQVETQANSPRPIPNRDLWEGFLNRKLTDEELFTLNKIALLSNSSEILDTIKRTSSFSEVERQILLESHPAVIREFARLKYESGTIFSIGRVNRNPKGLNFEEVKDLEMEFRKIKGKIKFHSKFDYELFNYFRFTPPMERATDLVAPMWRGEMEPNIELLNKKLWVRVVREEYQRVLFVLKNLGSAKMNEFPKQFGHVDHAQPSKIFSLRLNPEAKAKNGNVRTDTNFNLRALMGVDADGNIHVFKVYLKFTVMDKTLFDDAEQGFYTEAIEMAERMGVRLVHPLGLN